MDEAPENGKESSHSAHANGMNEFSILAVSPVPVASVAVIGRVASFLSPPEYKVTLYVGL